MQEYAPSVGRVEFGPARPSPTQDGSGARTPLVNATCSRCGRLAEADDLHRVDAPPGKHGGWLCGRCWEVVSTSAWEGK